MVMNETKELTMAKGIYERVITLLKRDLETWRAEAARLAVLSEYLEREVKYLRRVHATSEALFDNRLGGGDGRLPCAPHDFWANLGMVLYGESDARVVELRTPSRSDPDTSNSSKCVQVVPDAPETPETPEIKLLKHLLDITEMFIAIIDQVDGGQGVRQTAEWHDEVRRNGDKYFTLLPDITRATGLSRSCEISKNGDGPVVLGRPHLG